MNKLLVLLAFSIFGCSQHAPKQNIKTEPIEKVVVKTLNLPSIGKRIQGNFSKNGSLTTATVIKTQTGQGNPVEDGTADGYEIQFSDTTLKAIAAGCCDIRLVNEGDLNNNGTEEISIYQAPMNGCTYTMATYSLINGSWKQIVAPFLIPTGCERLSDTALQARVFSSKGIVYYLGADANDESGKLTATEVRIDLD